MAISQDDVLRLLAEHKLFASVDASSRVVWDSLSLTWFLTKIEQCYGLAIDPGEVEPDALGSVEAIHAFLEAHMREVQ